MKHITLGLSPSKVYLMTRAFSVGIAVPKASNSGVFSGSTTSMERMVRALLMPNRMLFPEKVKLAFS